MNIQRAAKRSQLQKSDRSRIRHMGSASTFLIGIPAVSVRPCRRSLTGITRILMEMGELLAPGSQGNTLPIHQYCNRAFAMHDCA